MAEAERFASDEEDFKAPSKKPLKLSRKKSGERRFDVSTTSELEEAAKGFVLKTPSVLLIRLSRCLAHGGKNDMAVARVIWSLLG